jgi:ppGpp synthetase/RelA/SpoT-type nucleotidyltranferase
MPLSDPEKILFRDMQDAARPALERLLATIEAISPLKESTYALRWRVKKYDSAIKKIEKRRGKGAIYGPADLTDIIGMRLVTPYRLDIVRVLDLLLDLIEGAGHHPPFLRGQLVEAIFFATPDDPGKGDPTSNVGKAFDLIKSRFPNVRPISREGSYSGLHILALLDGSRDLAPYTHGIPVEIQIRSVFEDVWAEIDHFACYKNEELEPGGPKRPIQHQVDVLKKLVDAAAGHADLIRAMRDGPDTAAPRTESGTITKSLSAAADVSAILSKRGIPATVSDRIVSLIEQREELFARRLDKSVAKPDAQEFIDIAARLTRIATQQALPGGWIHKGEAPARVLDYFLKMETALAYFYAETPESIERAISLYTDVRDDQPNSYVARYRLGQAYAKQRKHDDAIDHYSEALKAMDRPEDPSSAIDEQTLLSAEHKADLKWRTQKLLGFQYYKKSLRYEASRNAKEKNDYLKRAYDITTKAEPACTDLAQKRSITNNRLFYAAEYMEVQRLHEPDARGFLSDKELRTLFDRALANLTDGTPSHYDTIAYVANILELHDVARSAAEHVLEMLPSADYPEDENDTMIGRAWKITKKYGAGK